MILLYIKTVSDERRYTDQRRKKENRRISRERILIENINAKIKVFKIMKYPYRNRRKRHLLRLRACPQIKDVVK